jgi:hypothetical protein
MRNVIDFTPDGLMEQLPNLVVPATCASRTDLSVAIEQVQQAAKLLAAMKSNNANPLQGRWWTERTAEAHLLFRCETELRVAVGRDVGEF